MHYTTPMEKFFNTAGPVNPEIHYCIPPAERLDLDEIMRLIDQHKYFILHAPRQTGKTSSLPALMHHVNKAGQLSYGGCNIKKRHQSGKRRVSDGGTGN